MALHLSCEIGRPFGENVGKAERAVWSSVERAAALDLPAELRPPSALEVAEGSLLEAQLSRWAQACPRPLVLIFDEIDAPQLVLMAWLHRIVNGGGSVEREVVVRWPFVDGEGRRAIQRVAMELEVWRDRDKKGDPLARGLPQLDEYLGRLGLDEGVLVIFDCRTGAAPIDERTQFHAAQTASGRSVTVLRA